MIFPSVFILLLGCSLTVLLYTVFCLTLILTVLLHTVFCLTLILTVLLYTVFCLTLIRCILLLLLLYVKHLQFKIELCYQKVCLSS